MLRVYAYEVDLDAEKARQVLQFDSSDSAIKSSLVDEDEEVFAIEFIWPSARGERVPPEREDFEPSEKFRAAVTWLRARTEDSFHELKEMGLAYDLLVEGYVGLIPVDLLKELSRLGIGLWIAPLW